MARLNPECEQGKHQNCNDLTWDSLRDEEVPCPCVCHQPVLPEMPYAGTSGGSEASREARLWLDEHGVTAVSQRAVWSALRASRAVGATVAELRDGPTLHPTLGVVALGHHGLVSGALSVLHTTGHLVLLAEQRARCHVYVLPEHVGERKTWTPQPSAPRQPRAQTDLQQYVALLQRARVPFIEEATRHRTPPPDAHSVLTGDWRYRDVPVPEAPHHSGHEGCVTEHVFDATGALWAVWSWAL